MKVWPALAYGGTIAALYLLLRRSMAGLAIMGTVVYAWNPLVLLEALQNGHNDVVAALPTLLAVWAGRGGRWRMAFLLLAVGLLVKPLAAVVRAVLLLAAWKSGRAALREALIGMALAGGGVALAYVPFFGGLATLQGLERGDLFSASPAELLMNGLTSAGWPLKACDGGEPGRDQRGVPGARRLGPAGARARCPDDGDSSGGDRAQLLAGRGAVVQPLVSALAGAAGDRAERVALTGGGRGL